MTVQDYLSAAYSARRGQLAVSPIPDFIAAMNADPDLLASAKAKQAELTDAVCIKCFCSRVYRDVLDAALPQVVPNG
jgi:hypothetical protein